MNGPEEEKGEREREREREREKGEKINLESPHSNLRSGKITVQELGGNEKDFSLLFCLIPPLFHKNKSLSRALLENKIIKGGHGEEWEIKVVLEEINLFSRPNFSFMATQIQIPFLSPQSCFIIQKEVPPFLPISR